MIAIAPILLLGILVCEEGSTSAEYVDDALQCSIRLPEKFRDASQNESSSSLCRASWSANLGQYRCDIDFWVFNRPFKDPEEAAQLFVASLQNPNQWGKEKNFVEEERELVDRPVGRAGFGMVVHGTRHSLANKRPVSSAHLLTTVFDDKIGALIVDCSPPAGKSQRKVIQQFLEEGLRYDGPADDPNWTEEEAVGRWEEHAPESASGKEFKKPIRTKHYIILTNSSGGTSFAKKMEENYKKIQKIYPFLETSKRKLMPVFLFRTADEYYDFSVSVAGWTLEAARRTKGHAWRDYYATYYESPNDPVHIHEATHQIFANRLHLNGGGSWYQEGVAEYIETSKNDRNEISGMVERGQATPLPELLRMPGLIAKGDNQRLGDMARYNYKLAALFIEFLRESRFGKRKFPQFLKTLGSVPRSNLNAIDRGFLDVYGVGIDGVEEEFLKYCEKR